MKWLLVAVIAAATTLSDVLQAAAMKRHGEIRDFRPGALARLLAMLARNKLVVASVVAMTVSFFAFIALLSVADLSFAVPATAASYVIETVPVSYTHLDVYKRQARHRRGGADPSRRVQAAARRTGRAALALSLIHI